MGSLLQLLLDGVCLGLLYGMSAIGFILIYRSSNLLNFAHGGMMGLGAFFFFVLSIWIKWPIVIAFVAALVLSAALGLVFEKWLVRPVSGRENLIHYLMITLGLALMLEGFLSFVWGRDTDLFPGFVSQGLTLNRYNLQFTPLHFIAMASGICVMVLYRFFFTFSSHGISMRAFAENRLAARTLGIPSKRVLATSWAVSAFLCALSGILLGMITGTAPGSLSTTGLKVLPVIILGGINSITGAVLGGMFIGLLETFAGVVAPPPLRNLIPFMVLFIVLILKPSGLFGEKTPKKV